jgi:hypothetical protein
MNSPYKEAEFKLTERQRQIVRELAQGITNKNRSQPRAAARYREGSAQPHLQRTRHRQAEQRLRSWPMGGRIRIDPALPAADRNRRVAPLVY